MSGGRLVRRVALDDDDAAEFNLARVSRHRGRIHDFLRRHRREAARVVEGGHSARKRVAPFLVRRIADERTLRIAWDYLVENRRASRGRGAAEWGSTELPDYAVWQLLRLIRDDIRRGDYQPGPEVVCHIPKGPGRGTRPIVVQGVEDRTVQRAAVLILQPLLDPLFDSRSFGFRPRRSTLDALAEAERILQSVGRAVWVTQDLRDAFLRVPLGRLIQVVKKYLMDDGVADLIERIVSGASTPGLRQGGPLSPLLLNLYLHHHLDRPWRKQHPEVPLLRYADDLLVMCRTKNEARQVQKDLSALLVPAGMMLKGDPETSVRTLTSGSPAEWLGFRLEREQRRLRIELAETAWESIEDALRLAALEGAEEIRKRLILNGWLGQMGPAYRSVDHEIAYLRIAAVFGPRMPAQSKIKAVWQRAYARWCKFRRIRLAPEAVPPSYNQAATLGL